MHSLAKIICELKESSTLFNEIKDRLEILFKRSDNNVTQEIVMLINELLDNAQRALIWQRNVSLVIDMGAVLLRNEHTSSTIDGIIESLEITINHLKGNVDM